MTPLSPSASDIAIPANIRITIIVTTNEIKVIPSSLLKLSVCVCVLDYQGLQNFFSFVFSPFLFFLFSAYIL